MLPTSVPLDLSVTGLTGGHNLDAVPTVGLDNDYVLQIVSGSPTKQATQWQLTASPPPVGTGVVQPLDYDPDTNARRWVQVL